MSILTLLALLGGLLGSGYLWLARRGKRKAEAARDAAIVDKRVAEGERDDAKLRETVNVAAEANNAAAAREGAAVPAGVAAAKPRTPEETIRAADTVRR